jgi:hypothetical protein
VINDNDIGPSTKHSIKRDKTTWRGIKHEIIDQQISENALSPFTMDDQAASADIGWSTTTQRARTLIHHKYAHHRWPDTTHSKWWLPQNGHGTV